MKHKKWSKKLFRVTIGAALFVLTLYLAFNAYVGVTYAIELNAGQSEITIDQTDLFNITNMYPGQPALESKQPLKVINTGASDFHCSITSKLVGGDQRLFDILKIGILDDNGAEVYSGSLGTLDQLKLATLSPGSSKTFDFTLELPEDVDNSYQRLSTAFQFNIAASGGSGGGGGGSGGGGSEEPENPGVEETQHEVILPPESSEPAQPDQSSEPDQPAEPIPDPVVGSPMPNTGVPSHLPYYTIGLAAISAGLFLGFKKK